MSNIIKGYLSGNIFDSLLAQDKKNFAHQLRALSNENTIIEVFNPIENIENTQHRYVHDATKLFQLNNQYIDNADFIIIDLSDHNSQTLVEFGRITTLIEKVKKNIKVYILWRLKNYDEQYHFAINRYVRGAVEKFSQYYSTNEAIIEQIKKDFNL